MKHKADAKESNELNTNKIVVEDDIVWSKKDRIIFFLKELVVYCIFIFALVVTIGYICANYVGIVKVKGESMLPTYNNGQIILMNRHEPTYDRGDVVIVDETYEGDTTSYYVIKRIIAFAGDKIEFDNDTSSIYVNNEKIDESYLNDAVFSFPDEYNNYVVPQNYVFVMGDNRNNSYDSRDYGPIQESQLMGKVINWGKIINF